MLFHPDHELKLLEEENYARQLREVTAALEPYAHCGVLEGDCPLDYVYYLSEAPRGAVVILHGLTEFKEKYREMTWYFLHMGYHVFLYDQRGHGASGREVEDLSLIHVDRFSRYTEDLESFLTRIVEPAAGGQTPLYLLGHSMGGAVGALYLQQGAARLRGAILSSPMISPNTFMMPRRLLRAIVRRDARKKGEKAPFRLSGPFDPEPSFAAAGDSSYARFRANLELRLENPRLRNSGTTNAWVCESLTVRETLLSREGLEKTTCPVLVFEAGQDRSVSPHALRRYVRGLPRGTYVRIPRSRHCILTGTGEILRVYYREIFRFLEEGERL